MTTGQRKYGGPPPAWEGPSPGNGCEVCRSINLKTDRGGNQNRAGMDKDQRREGEGEVTEEDAGWEARESRVTRSGW